MVTLPRIGRSSLFSLLRPIVATVTVLVLLGPSPLGAADLELHLRSFPADAQVVIVSGRNGRFEGVVTATERRDSWRIFPAVPDTAILELRHPGYQTRRIHLPASSTPGVPVSVEERLLPAAGPLHAVAEAPTGVSPKSVTFLAPDTIAVPLLRDSGLDLYRIVSDRWGTTSLDPAGRLEPPSRWAEEVGFVESIVLPDSHELWVSQMNTAMVQRFDLAKNRWIAAYPSGGGWPKVLAVETDESAVWVSNWDGENVVRIDRRTGERTTTVPLGGQPRGMVLTENDRTLWVCIFSSGEVVRVDTATAVVTDRLGQARGAARHIVASPRDQLIYYSDMLHGTVNVIDPARREVVRSRRVGINVNTIVFDPSGRYLFVSERGRNNPDSYLIPGPEFGRIIVLDPETLETIQEVWGRHQPTGLAVSPDGRFLAATDFLDDNVALYRIDDPR